MTYGRSRFDWRGICINAAYLVIAVPALAAERDWSTTDSIAVRYLAEDLAHTAAINPDPTPSAPRDGSGAIGWSPDSRYFFFISHAGDLACDCNHYTLTLYDARKLAAVLKSSELRSSWTPTPLKEVSFSTTSSNDYMAGISAARWIDDDTLVFIGTRDGFRQLFKLSASTGALTQLTDSHDPDDPERPDGDDRSGTLAGVAGFELQGNTLMYFVSKYMRQPPLVRQYPAVSIAEARLSNLHYFGSDAADIYIAHPAGAPPKHVALCRQRGGIGFISVSPDGSRGITTCKSTPVSSPAIRDRLLNEIVQYLVVDVSDGTVREIASAPAKARATAVWSDDGTHVAVFNAFVKSSTECPSESQLHVVDYDVRTQTASCVMPMSEATGFRVRTAQWRDHSKALVVTGLQGKDSVDITLQLRDGHWTRAAPRMTPAARRTVTAQKPVDVAVMRSANEPWKILARFGAKAIDLTLPDPALAGLRLTSMKPFTWSGKYGDQVGGLYLPRDSANMKLPLVIQSGYYVPERFFPDGSASTAYAAQALAAQGMAVLNVDPLATNFPDGVSSEEAFGERVESAVAALEQAGIIDAQRVGILGFSHDGYQTHYLATHPRSVKFAAGIVADSWAASYVDYTVYDAAIRDSAALLGPTELKYGGPFWKNKEAWVREAPMFNVDRVTAPILFSLHTKESAILAAETIAAYRINRKPFEYLLFPEGTHQLVRPLERKASLDATVAWMAFWLQGRELAGLQSPETYERWRKMKMASSTQ